MDLANVDVDKLLAKLVNEIDRMVKLGIDKVPDVERFVLNLLDQMFAPRQIARQIAMISVLQVVLMCYSQLSSVWTKISLNLTEKGRKEKAMIQELKNAETYSEWQIAAQNLDKLRGFDVWRQQDHSTLYDHRMLQKRILFTREMLRRGDVFDLMFRMRGGLARDQFGMQHEGLFSRALAGTKIIVEKYLETIADGLNFICDSPIADEEIPTEAKLAFFNEVRHSYGRTALLLSGGAFLGFYHMGVVRALWTEGLLPRVISGASAGSIMTAIIGTREEEDFQNIFNAEDASNGVINFPEGFRTDFFRYSEELKSEMARRLNYFVPQGLRWITQPIFGYIFDKKILNLDTEHLKQCLIADVGLYTFQEAFDKTGRIINITVAPNNNYDPPRLLNYLTAPHVCVWSAAAASCALPGIFDSVSLIVKEPNGQFRPENEWTRQALVDNEDIKAVNLASYSDGSVENDLPMQQLSELFNVNHFIVSQVNPHSAILSSMGMAATVWSNPVYNTLVGYLRFLTAQCRDWVKNIVKLFIFRSRAPIWSSRRGFTQTITQDYEGRDVDVTINPWSGHISAATALMSAIHNPTEEEYVAVVHAAEVNTWPAIPRIRAHCLVETTLEQCVQRLRKRMTAESEAAQLAALNHHYQQQGDAGANPGMFKKDRTPSFYTSKSLVNLSGLSISDPAPIQQVWYQGQPQHQQPQQQREKSHNDSFKLNKNHLSPKHALKQADSSEDEESEQDRQLVDNLSFNSVDVGVMPLTGSSSHTLSHLTTNSGNNAASLNGIFPSATGERENDTPRPRRSRLNSHSTPLQPGSDLQLNTLANAHSNNSGGQLNDYFTASTDSYDQGDLSGAPKRRGSHSSHKEETLFHKTTNMASFYYRKSTSTDHLKDMGAMHLLSQNNDAHQNAYQGYGYQGW
eukprot:gene8825-10437_t